MHKTREPRSHRKERSIVDTSYLGILLGSGTAELVVGYSYMNYTTCMNYLYKTMKTDMYCECIQNIEIPLEMLVVKVVRSCTTLLVERKAYDRREAKKKRERKSKSQKETKSDEKQN